MLNYQHPDISKDLIDFDEPLFEFVLVNSTSEESTRSIYDRHCRLISINKIEETHVAVFRFEGEDIVDVTLSFSCQGQEVLSHAEVKHQGSSILKSFRYPISHRKNLATFDQLLISSAWGDCIPRPAKTIHDLGESTSVKFEQDYIVFKPNELIYSYPAIMAMQYMALFNDAESFYFATYSTRDETMTFHAKSTGKFSVELAVTHYPFMNNENWTSPDCSVAKLGGGWHDAADIYRQHMKSKFNTPNYPAWIKDNYHGWVEFGMKRENQPINFKYNDISRIYSDMHKKTGMNHMFVVGWHDNGHDTKFPRYMLCEEAGTSDELNVAIESVHNKDGKISLYTNARLVDIDEDFYHGGGKNAVSLDKQGHEYHESYHTASTYAVSCPGCEEYVNQMKSVAARICGEYGADGMFVDQISCNLDPFCYNNNHFHSRPSNNFLPGVERELGEIRKITRSKNDQFHTFAEGCHERFNQLYDINQGHGEEFTWQVGQSVPEQFLYTFPDRIVTGHCADKNQMYHSMSQFKPLDIKASCYNDESNHDALRKYISLRQMYPEFFFRGRFIDDKGLIYQKGVRAHAILAENDSMAISLWMPGAHEKTPCHAFLKLPEKKERVGVLPFVETKVVNQDDWLEIEWIGGITFLVLS